MLDATPLLRWYAKYRLKKIARALPVAVQEQQLHQLIRDAADTRFGQEHHFHKIKSVTDYQARVPLRSYEQFWQEYWQPVFPHLTNCTWPGTIPLFPVSSGTTSGVTKYIPYSWQMDRSNRKAGLDLLVHHINNRPATRIMGGKCFMLGGSTELLEQAPGIYSGDLSGIAVKTMPWWARLRYFPPRNLALIKDWEEKIELLARSSLQESITMISGVPSWMLIFFNKLFELNQQPERQIAAVYPQLEMLVHGGVNFAPYRQQFEELLSTSHAELREVYPASEGFIAIADQQPGQGLRMILDHGIFFEFVPLEELNTSNPTRHWLANVELNVNYAVVLTTCAGLWSYILGDTVRFVDLNPPRLLVTGRTSYCLSAFGEHLIGEEIEDAINLAAQNTGLTVTDYSVGPIFPKHEGELGTHRYIVEFTDDSVTKQQKSAFLQALDQYLCTRNEDYEAHRCEGFGLRAPELVVVPPGSFRAWMKQRGKLGGQHKVPRIITDCDLFNDLQDFMYSV